jgi:SAM-dependent methyltransferase
MEARNDMDRQELARELHGHGVEFGPGCHPLKLGPFVKSVRYCDAHDRAGFAALFPEAAESVSQFPDPIDFRLQFDREPFVDAIGRGLLDFVVANHLLEHLIDPIGFLDQCHQVLTPDGLLYLGLPDKRRIFDRDRRRTTLTDLVARHEAGVMEVSDERIAEFVNQVERPAEPLRPGVPERRELYEWHRRRSVHVNVWVLDDIIELFLYLGRNRQTPWALHDGLLGGGEFLLLFRKTDRSEVLDSYPATLARMYADSHERQFVRRLDDVRGRLGELGREIAEVGRFVRGLKKVASAVPGGRAIRRWAKNGAEPG